MGGWNSKHKKGELPAKKTLMQEPKVETVPATPVPIKVDSKLVPEWINKSLFEELLVANVPQYSKILDFRAKPAMAPGENYATLMLRITIEVELTDKSSKTVSFMMKVPHKTPQMEQMLAIANFFKTETSAYIDFLPKMENLYKSKGMDITFGPRAFTLDTSKEPNAANIVLMDDLGQAGFKNFNRLECLNFEQAKFAIKKLAQFHAAGAMMVQVHGPYPDIFVYGVLGKNPEMIKGFVEGMLGPFRTAFLANLNKFKDGEKYRSKLDAALANLTSEFMRLGEIDPSAFNVLGHGDCWMNNLLFKVDSKGEVEDMVFVDFQNPKYGTPLMDLMYFIITSVHIDYKLDCFDYFVRHYHEQLTRHLDFLGFTGRQPTLRELHSEVMKFGTWCLFPAIAVLPVVLLDPSESATFDNFMGESEAGREFKNLIYSNKRYHPYIEKILPWLENKGFLEVSKPNPTPNPPTNPADISTENPQQILDWLNVNDFQEIIPSLEPNFDKIVGGSWTSATKPGDNFASKLLKVDIEAQLKDNTKKSFSFIVKVHISHGGVDFSVFNLFPKEIEVYSKYVPGFEKLYQEAGVPVTFSPKSFRLNKDIAEEYLILENLQSSGFKMCDRTQGLDLEHTKSVLKKLAQWHAASLKYKELNGAYPPKYDNGIYSEQSAPVFKGMFALTAHSCLAHLAKFDGAEEYVHKLSPIFETAVDKLIEDSKINEKEFNVLNHGDSWINNIMFQYDGEGQLKETFLLDHQVTKYGNPAQDLYYFIMSSTQLEIKVDKFDSLINWYHQNLDEHTKLLKYSGFVPSLKELHTILLEHPAFGVFTALSTMPMCLNKTDENFTTESFFQMNEEGDVLRAALYGNERFKAHIERIMPWLNRRGLLDAFVQ
ncbi:hypothetical protein KR074_008364 [Drosophila pseudoananassae]|nr:hypothetical protein KR074_008364 [Drosophila pseudoananassae]